MLPRAACSSGARCPSCFPCAGFVCLPPLSATRSACEAPSGRPSRSATLVPLASCRSARAVLARSVIPGGPWLPSGWAPCLPRGRGPVPIMSPGPGGAQRLSVARGA
eukprot:11813664-Alexandrium_andersonii.AAC.1